MPWKFVCGSRGALRLNGIIVLPRAFSTSSGYVPTRSEGLISTFAKRYEPFSLTETSDTRSSGFKERTFAPLRFVPRTSRRTGLIVCFAHHDGGSTFVTVGVCEYAEPATKKHKKHKTLNEGRLCFFVAFISSQGCGAWRCHRKPR